MPPMFENANRRNLIDLESHRKYSCTIMLKISIYKLLNSIYTGLSKFHFDVRVFLLKFVHVKCIWVHARAREVFKTVKFPLASL